MACTSALDATVTADEEKDSEKWRNERRTLVSCPRHVTSYSCTCI